MSSLASQTDLRIHTMGLRRIFHVFVCFCKFESRSDFYLEKDNLERLLLGYYYQQNIIEMTISLFGNENPQQEDS
jgi:hypothetical protein